VNMEKSPIAFHKSHMSGEMRVPARSSSDPSACPTADRVTVGSRAKGARSTNRGSDATGTRSEHPRTADAGTCKVWEGPAAWRSARRGMAESGSRAGLATQATDRVTGMARGSGIPVPVRGARRGAGGWQNPWDNPSRGLWHGPPGLSAGHGATKSERDKGHIFRQTGQTFRSLPGYRVYHGARASSTPRTCNRLHRVTLHVQKVIYLNL